MAQKWIQRIWNKIGKEPQDLIKLYNQNPTNWVYIIFNNVTKRIYVGETQRTLVKRMAEHYGEYKRGSKRKCYSYMNKLPFGCWTIIPIQKAKDDKDLEHLEKVWKYNLKNNLINDPTIWTLKTAKKNRKNPKTQTPPKTKKEPNHHQQVRTLARQYITRELRRTVRFVLHGAADSANAQKQTWRRWKTEKMLDLLCHLREAKVPRKEFNEVHRRLKPIVYKQTDINI